MLPRSSSGFPVVVMMFMQSKTLKEDQVEETPSRGTRQSLQGSELERCHGFLTFGVSCLKSERPVRVCLKHERLHSVTSPVLHVSGLMLGEFGGSCSLWGFFRFPHLCGWHKFQPQNPNLLCCKVKIYLKSVENASVCGFIMHIIYQ